MKRLIVCAILLVAPCVFAEDLTVQQIAATPTLWPREITVTVPHEAPLILKGQAAGKMQVPAGHVYVLKAVKGDTVEVDGMGAPLKFPASETDLVARADKLRQLQLRVAAASPASKAQPAPPAPQVAAPVTPPASNIQNKLAAKLREHLFTVEKGKAVPYDASRLTGKKYLAIYYSASWCPPCRAFSPKLVSWYKANKSKLDSFDLILVGEDHSQDEVVAYMKSDDMPWPAVDYEYRGLLSSYAGDAIPDLVVLDADGQVVADTFVNGEYVGPEQALAKFQKLLRAP